MRRRKRTWLEGLLHPVIREELMRQLRPVNYSLPYVLLVSPLLLETDQHELVEKVVVVDVPVDVQIQRTMARDTNDREQVETHHRRSDAARTTTPKSRRRVVDNNLAMMDVERQVEQLHQTFLAAFGALVSMSRHPSRPAVDALTLTPIAITRSCFRDKFGVPRQPGLTRFAHADLIIQSPFDREDAFRGLETASHLWLTFQFHEAVRAEWRPVVRPPRLGGNKKIGVFASRSPFRPNSLGLVSREKRRTDAGRGRSPGVADWGPRFLSTAPPSWTSSPICHLQIQCRKPPWVGRSPHRRIVYR